MMNDMSTMPALFSTLRLRLATAMICLTAAAPSLAAGTAGTPSVAPGTRLVIADDARATEMVLELSGQQDALAADVSYASFSSGPLRMEALRAGAADVAIVGDVPPILAHHSGQQMKIVGVITSDGPGLLLATSPQSGIKQWQDLRGKRVGVNDGTAQQAVLLRNLAAVGLGAQDIVKVNLGVSEFADALRANQIDAAVVKQPDRARYLLSASRNGALALDNAPGTNTGILYAYASPAALADPAKTAAIRDFISGWYRAHQWKNDNPEAWLKSYLVANQRLKPEDAQQVLESQGKTHFPGLTPQLIARQQDTIDLLQQAGAFAAKELRAEDEFDLRFADIAP